MSEKSKETEKEKEVGFENTVFISNGRKATIKAGKGIHAMRAQKMAGTDMDKYLNILMSLLVRIDTKPVTQEDLEDLPLADYMAIQAKFSEINFTSEQVK